MTSVLVQKLARQSMDKCTCHIKVVIREIARVKGLANKFSKSYEIPELKSLASNMAGLFTSTYVYPDVCQ